MITTTIGTIYEALDLRQNNKKVAIKVEKEDKSKKVLQFEYSVLITIQRKVLFYYILTVWLKSKKLKINNILNNFIGSMICLLLNSLYVFESLR